MKPFLKLNYGASKPIFKYRIFKNILLSFLLYSEIFLANSFDLDRGSASTHARKFRCTPICPPARCPRTKAGHKLVFKMIYSAKKKKGKKATDKRNNNRTHLKTGNRPASWAALEGGIKIQKGGATGGQAIVDGFLICGNMVQWPTSFSAELSPFRCGLHCCLVRVVVQLKRSATRGVSLIPSERLPQGHSEWLWKSGGEGVGCS